MKAQERDGAVKSLLHFESVALQKLIRFFFRFRNHSDIFIFNQSILLKYLQYVSKLTERNVNWIMDY